MLLRGTGGCARNARLPKPPSSSEPKRANTIVRRGRGPVARMCARARTAVVPEASSSLLDQLTVPAEARRFADLADRLPPGRALPAPHGIFPRFVETETASA